MSRTWILVANRVRARLLEFDDQDREIAEISDFIHPEGRAPSGTRGDTRPPRTMDRMGPGRHAIEPQTVPSTKHAERFARDLVGVLEDGRVHHRFDHVVLIATSQLLGHLRQCMAPPLRECVHREIGKDMTRSEIDTIRNVAMKPFAESA